MLNKSLPDSALKQIVGIAASMIVATLFTIALVYLRVALVPFVISLFTYFSIIPLVDYLKLHLKIPRFVSLSLAFICGGLTTMAIGLIIVTSVKSFLVDAGIYQNQLLEAAHKASGFLLTLGIEVNGETIKDAVRSIPIASTLKNFTGGVTGLLGMMSLVVVFLLFLFAGHDSKKEPGEIRVTIDHKVRQYLLTKLTMSVVTGLSVGCIFMVLGLELAVMFAILTFFLNFIPSVGSLIAVGLPFPIAFLQFGLDIRLFLVILLPGVVQIVIGNVIEPKLMGEHLGIHPIVLLMALIFWGSAWGLPGMFLAVPMTAVIKIACERIPALERIAWLIEGCPRPSAE